MIPSLYQNISINNVFEDMEDILTVDALDGFLTDTWHWKDIQMPDVKPFRYTKQ